MCRAGIHTGKDGTLRQGLRGGQWSLRLKVRSEKSCTGKRGRTMIKEEVKTGNSGDQNE